MRSSAFRSNANLTLLVAAAAVSIAASVLVISGMFFFKAGWFSTGSRNIGEENLESYYGGIGTVVSPFTRGSLEGLSLYELDEISKGLVGWFILEGPCSSTCLECSPGRRRRRLQRCLQSSQRADFYRSLRGLHLHLY